MSYQKPLLDPTKLGNRAWKLLDGLRDKVVGQSEAIEAIAKILQVYLAGLSPVGRPIGNMLFLGPTGSGKTRTVEALAETLYGDQRAMIKIDCAEFQHSHEIAKLIGSPPGYLGHRETHPILTQEALDQWHNDQMEVSLLLLDEIEKASDALWQLLLGILDRATLTLGDNRRVDLSQTIVFMTSNLGAREMSQYLQKGGIGFRGEEDRDPPEVAHEKIERMAKDATRKRFAPEFMNRIDQVVVFYPLNLEQLKKILDIELGIVHGRILHSTPGHTAFLFHLTDAAKTFLIREGTDKRYGARHLKRAIEKHLVSPLANLVATDQAKQGDLISVDWNEKENCLVFYRDAEDMSIPIHDGPGPRKPANTSRAIVGSAKRA